jgi:hypothetical protein
MEPAFLEWGATIERGPHGVRIAIETTRKRQVAEMLWAADCDVISITPMRSSLEELFLKLVGGGGAPA